MINLRRLFQQNPNLNEEVATRVFQFFDSDGGGFIDTAELQEALRALGFRCTHLGARLVIDSVDTDGDGVISLKEWLDLLRDSRAQCEAATDKFRRFRKEDDMMVKSAGIAAIARNDKYLQSLRTKVQNDLSKNKAQWELEMAAQRRDTHEAVRQLQQQPFRKSSNLVSLTRRTHLAALAGDFDYSNALEFERAQLEVRDRERSSRTVSQASGFIKKQLKDKQQLSRSAMNQRAKSQTDSLLKGERRSRSNIKQKIVNVQTNVGRSHRRAEHLLSSGQTDLGKHLTTGRRYASGLNQMAERLDIPSLSMESDFTNKTYKGESELTIAYSAADEMKAKLKASAAATMKLQAAEQSATFPGPGKVGKNGDAFNPDRPGAHLRRRASLAPNINVAFDKTVAVEFALNEQDRLDEEYEDNDNLVRWSNDKGQQIDE